ncbi:MAG: DUF1186 domain-containing protein [Chloroflexi bacterium]|nr:DUF1186 domain-containing protein [Chloroflexota bacterium]
MTTNYHALSAPELLHELEYAGRAPDLELIRVCMERRAELTPGLLDLLAAPPDEDWVEDDPRWYAPIHAGNLLIHYREPQAIPIFMRLLRDPKNDSMGEWFDTALASYGMAILPAVCELLLDDTAQEYPRISMTATLEELAAEFPTERGQVTEILRAALPPLDAEGNLVAPKPRLEKLSGLWSFVATALAKLHDLYSRPQIEALYRDGWMDAMVMGDQKKYLELLMSSEPLTSQPFNIIETYEEMQALVEQEAEWQAKHEEILAQQEKLAQAAQQTNVPILPATMPDKPQTIRRTEPKVGRNDPCPCGSGRKYKHCHGK